MPTTTPPKIRTGTTAFFVLIPVLLLFSTGCGYRGPLYLPDDTQGGPSSEVVSPDDSDDSEETETDEEEDRDVLG